MFYLSFSPQRSDDILTVEKTNDDRLRINGELFNFNPLNDGDVIPAGAIPCNWIVGPVEKVDGTIHITLILPYGLPSTSVETPAPITVSVDGVVALPSIDEKELTNVDA